MRKLMALGFVVCGFGLLAGCAENKMTRQRFDMIKEGTSTRDEVKMTLGDEYQAMGRDQWEYEDEHKHLHATIHFDDRGVVTRKEWMDAKTGEWSGAAPGIRDPQSDPQSQSHQTINKH